ncbi:MAG: SRPBCC family protein [Ardenticatenaceae bacterium]|nr:SRPBCC family protein [Ardenticatenaceae bacterium]
MSGFTLSEWINHPVEDVFEALMSPEKAPKVMSNIKSMKQLTPGPVGVGTRFREIRLMNGQEQQTDLEVVRFEAPTRYSVTAEASGIEVTYHYHLKPQDNGTQVEMECVVSTKGLKKLMLPVVAQVMKKEDSHHLQDLKLALESA